MFIKHRLVYIRRRYDDSFYNVRSASIQEPVSMIVAAEIYSSILKIGSKIF